MINTQRSIIGSALVLSACIFLIGCGSEAASPSSSRLSNDGSASVVNAADKPEGEPISFNRDIRPILSENCFFCHGPDAKHQEADLRLDFFEHATRDLGGYAAIVPGDREGSETWHRIIDKEDPMPPVKSHKKLTEGEIELIGRWIDQGATYETHWSYAPVVRVDPPEVKNEAWVSNAIDRFILAELESRKIEPSPKADRRTLLRRVTYNLTGLPPTPGQAAAFLNDTSPQAYENYVDSLLADETYGEHLAVWWLDLVRYADSEGFHGDQGRTAWPYREWVIKSLNANMPFDRFTTMQLAGDLMQDEPTQEMLIASAYNRLAPQTEEGGAQHKEYETIYNADRVANYADTWLGSSVACAQCHDHKFDPFSAEDFYTLASFFSDINEQIIGHRNGYARHTPPYILLPQNEEQAAKVKEHNQTYAAFIDKHPMAKIVEERLTCRDYKPPVPNEQIKANEFEAELKKLIDARHKLANEMPTVGITRALPTPRTVRILARGNWQDETGEIVLPATPAFLGGPRSTEGNRLTRLDLAKWTVSPENPLTARVVANRLWGKYLGTAISSNTIELGSQGVPPTHPALLDYLATEFAGKGWDLKHLIRMIVTSSAYQQSADARDDLANIDPDNTKLFARQSALRLSAEVIRDKALAVSGLLKPRLGGPSVFPYQPDGHWEPLNFPRRPYPTSKGDDLYRRSVYSWVQRTFPHPAMVNFDSPSRETCTGQRMVSNTPLGALTTLNGPTFVEAARTLAATLLTEYPSDANRLDTLYQLVLARTPRDTERQALTKLLDSQRKHFAKNPEDAKKLIAVGASPVEPDADPAELAAWASACRVVLNLHEALTRN
ncbi:MAG: PSD1 and planctomycete cytochrome C domain-containing protein [Phycisphaeraceae bacterium]|nr:PSD1 and planctomycete cytochrome C domain-containing protein [Phycisphaeraceae bacterium]